MPFLLALAISLLMTPVLGRLGLRLALVDHPSNEDLKIHTGPTPVTGGIGVMFAALVGVAAWGDGVPVSVLVASIMMLTVGIADDLRTLSPLLRLVAQLGAGAALALGGASFAPIGDLGPLGVVIAIPLLTNAVNIVDGQDGLATGLAVIAAIGLSAIAATQGNVPTIGPPLIGALMGFLVWNKQPASVFLGNGGAYGVGCLLGVLAIASSSSWEALLGSVICLGVFALELTSTVLRRTVRRSPLLSGDRAHAYDLIAGIVGSRARATSIMWVAGVFAAVLGWLVAQARLPLGVVGLAVTFAAGSIAIRGVWRASLRRSG
jgi:UDP-GlcNAc:undecaprenyl-phosphate/decaprenyl-phosphate GlcNAc-1-phosphate transferase